MILRILGIVHNFFTMRRIHDLVEGGDKTTENKKLGKKESAKQTNDQEQQWMKAIIKINVEFL